MSSSDKNRYDYWWLCFLNFKKRRYTPRRRCLFWQQQKTQKYRFSLFFFLTFIFMLAHTLPELPYAYSALEPHIDALTMEIHHSKHHQAYITNYIKLLDGTGLLEQYSPTELIQHLDQVPEEKNKAWSIISEGISIIVSFGLFWHLTPSIVSYELVIYLLLFKKLLAVLIYLRSNLLKKLWPFLVLVGHGSWKHKMVR